jgi:hypothetical protein
MTLAPRGREALERAFAALLKREMQLILSIVRPTYVACAKRLYR